MAWFTRQKTAPTGPRRPAAPGPHRGAVAEVRRLPPDHLAQGPGGEPAGLPQVRLPFQDRCRRPAAAAVRRRRVGGVRPQPGLHRSAGVRRPALLQGAPGRDEEGYLAGGRHDLRRRPAERPPGAFCALELKFIGGSMGAVVGEKITRAIERSVDAAAAADHRLGLRRRAHAGGRGQPDADGQDLRRADAAGRGPASRTSAC